MAGTGGDGTAHLDGAQRLLIEAVTAQMQRMMRENVRDRDDMSERKYERRGYENERRIRNEDKWERESERRERGYGRGYERERQERERIREIKLELPPFHGKNDVEAYLDWEMKVEQIFTCHNLEEEKKVKVATLAFQNYALMWWDQSCKERRRCGQAQIVYWDELKAILRRRFVPSYYHRELHNKLQLLHG